MNQGKKPGYISVVIPVKPYIKAYMEKHLGKEMKLSRNTNVIYNKLYDVLEKKQNPKKTEANCDYGEKVKIFLSVNMFKRVGCNLNATNTKNFNRFVEQLIKHEFRTLMNDMCLHLPSFEANLPIVRKRLGIDLEAWSDDSMKKEYYRYRVREKLPLFPKTFPGYIPSAKAEDLPF